MLLEVKDLEVSYGDYQVVWGVSLNVAAGESVALLGPNGSGKSTVVNAITGLIRSKAGDIRFENKQPGQPADACPRRARHRPRTGAPARVPASDRAAEPHARRLAPGRQGRAPRPPPSGSFPCFPRMAERKSQLARTLSGGEQQMLALGRGLMSLPRLLMVEEPFLGPRAAGHRPDAGRSSRS
jgi:branched-chain amino acid transport system ATP-binding protein